MLNMNSETYLHSQARTDRARFRRGYTDFVQCHAQI